jgi:nitrite reductase/ring-hydroxylating ferredoxin subunit
MRQPLAPVGDIPDDGSLTVDFFGREVLLLKVDGRPQAIANVCAHLGGPLERCGDKLVCAWHQAEFQVDSGARISGPARPDTKLMVLPTRVVDGVLTYVYGSD